MFFVKINIYDPINNVIVVLNGSFRNIYDLLNYKKYISVCLKTQAKNLVYKLFVDLILFIVCYYNIQRRKILKRRFQRAHNISREKYQIQKNISFEMDVYQ